MKFYEVRQNTGHSWNSLGFLRRKGDAKKYESLFNTKVMIYPTEIVEHKFLKFKDFEDEFKESL